MRGRPVLRLVRCALLSALLCVLSPLSIPFGPVPLSLALFAVLLCGVLLHPPEALLCVGVYLAIGALGMPVFAGFLGGVGVLLGPTGGFLIGYMLAALLVSILFHTKATGSPRLRLMHRFWMLLLPTFVCFLVGVSAFCMWSDMSIGTAISVCVLPFLPFDVLKCLGVAVLQPRLARAFSL